MQRWEYRLVRVHLGDRDDPAETARVLNADGDEGWEAVGFSPAHAGSHGLSVQTTDYVVLFKRAIEH